MCKLGATKQRVKIRASPMLQPEMSSASVLPGDNIFKASAFAVITPNTAAFVAINFGVRL
jgi:hypothetical protein